MLNAVRKAEEFMKQIFCTACGKKIEEDNTFCTNCGKAMSSKAGDTKTSVPGDSRGQGSTPVKPAAENSHASSEDSARKTSRIDNAPPKTSPVSTKRFHLSTKAVIWTLVILGAIIVVVILVVLFRHGGANTPTRPAASSNNSRSVVDIWCDNDQGGSGVIFTSDGTVLTNNHVIAGSTSCQVTIPDPETGQIAEIYDAAPVITPTLSQEYDVATLKIDGSYTDASGTTWGAYPTTFPVFTIPNTCNTSTQSQLNDSVRIYGYPVTSGGYNLTVTDGIISSFADDGDILTSAKVDSGNSGGLAVDQNGCWLGIPSAVVSGNYQNLGVIIPGSVVAKNFLSGAPAKIEPIAVSSDTQDLPPSVVAAPQETNDQMCQDQYGTYSQWSGSLNSSGQPTCECQTGYSWDGSGNECATQISLQQQCEDQYGSGSYSYPKNGKAICGCSSGYVWNSDQTACAQETNDQICQAQYGEYSEWSGQTDSNGPTCQCQTGYAWDATGKSCASQTSLDESCQNSYGLESYSYARGGKAVCGCQTGYQWNSDQTTCVAQRTPDQVCQRDVGSGSYYLGYKNSDGTYACSTP